jgi:hypothetical protein
LHQSQKDIKKLARRNKLKFGKGKEDELPTLLQIDLAKSLIAIVSDIDNHSKVVLVRVVLSVWVHHTHGCTREHLVSLYIIHA